MATKTATRRVKLLFDDKGNPACNSTTSPESFKVRAAVKIPPRDVIPVIFVPGVMGSNVCLVKEGSNPPEPGEIVWRPPNGAWEGLKAAWKGFRQNPAVRQRLFDPAKTIVDPRGPCSVPDTLFWLTDEEAQKRGWGTLHQDSYHKFLVYLEGILNERLTGSGWPMPDLNLTQFLGSPPAGKKPSSWLPSEESAEHWAKVNAKAATEKWQTPSPPPPVTEEDIKRLGKYFFPVWAHGYNWLCDNDDAATKLLNKIDEIVDRYRKSDYFECAGKVILVTHSMGGLVARRAAQKAPDKIIGVVHGALPVVGAPVLYRRMRAGMETGGMFDIVGKLAAQVIGSGSSEVTASICRAPGPLQLAPTKNYPPKWFKIILDKPLFGGKEKLLLNLPEKDPYEEIYSKTTDDCWWAMANPALIDPAGTIRKNGENPVGGDPAKVDSSEATQNDKKDPAEEYFNAIGIAEEFHDILGLYAHPETYGFYGIDNKHHQSFGHLEWRASPSGAQIQNKRPPEELVHQKAIWSTDSGKVTIYTSYRKYEGGPPEGYIHRFHLSNDRNQRGDGTVPENSGAVLRRLENIAGQDRIFGIEGFDHQGAYNDRFSKQATVYFLVRIARKSPPPSPPKGGEVTL